MTKFTEESSRRIGRAVKHVERNLRNEKAHRGRWAGWNSRWEIGKTNAEISAGGSVGVSIWQWNGSTFVDSGQDVTAYDWMLSGAQTIASGKKVVILKHRRNVWLIVSAECV